MNSRWTEPSGQAVIADYTKMLVEDALRNSLVPEVLLEAMRLYETELLAGKLSSLVPSDDRQHLPWDVRRSELVAELEHVLQSDDYQRSQIDLTTWNSFKPLVLTNPRANSSNQWIVHAADAVIRNAIAYDLYRVLLSELIRFAAPQIARYTMTETLILDDTLQSTLEELIAEVAQGQLTYHRQKEEKKRLRFIRRIVEQQPGTVLGGIALDILLPMTDNQSAGTFGETILEEDLVESFILDLLVDLIQMLDQNLIEDEKYPMLSLYHAAVDTDLFFEETLKLLVENLDHDMRDIDLMEAAEKRILISATSNT